MDPKKKSSEAVSQNVKQGKDAALKATREQRIKQRRSASRSTVIQHNVVQSNSGAHREEIETLDRHINDLERNHDDAERELEEMFRKA